MNALPMPAWGREGETWRVQPEDAVPWRTDVYGLLCRQGLRITDGAEHRTVSGRSCRERAVAGYTSRNGEFHPFCEDHLRDQNLWIEWEGLPPRAGRVVSWRLSK